MDATESPGNQIVDGKIPAERASKPTIPRSRSSAVGLLSKLAQQTNKIFFARQSTTIEPTLREFRQVSKWWG